MNDGPDTTNGIAHARVRAGPVRSADSGMSHVRRFDWRFAIAATLVVTCLVTLASWGRPGAPPFSVLHNRQVASWIAWLVLSPAVFVMARRFPLDDGSPFRWLGRHLLAGLAISAATLALAASLRVSAATFMQIPNEIGAEFVLGPVLVSRIATGLLVYALLTIGYQAAVSRRAARGRETVANRLRADLAEARLTIVEGQLHPHFLFNALNSIAALVRVDARQAETMLEQLSELLRATLRTNPMQEVPLDEALRLAEQYLAIEQVRFQDRLRATFNATAAARKGRVPQLILQPLVENAVRHGIAPLESGGSVRVTATVENETLRITVDDDGIGFGKGPANRAGTGLGISSVRALLSHLYGAGQRFDVAPRSPSGTTATIEIPYRTSPA